MATEQGSPVATEQGPPWSPSFRVLPRLTPENEFFWTSGRDGRLRFLRCTECGTWIHPPSPRCPSCLSKAVEPTPVSGRATIAACTVNHQPWIPGFDPPYVVAIVEIEEDPSVRLMTNIVGRPPEEVRSGMAVQVTFEHRDDVWLPIFEVV
ncbi:MAG: Zn-ribbon domain-containing OB-fold protein [Acidimicrobiales bacterium]